MIKEYQKNNLSTENKEIILNQIDRINIISKLNNNHIANKILYDFLVYSIDYGYIALSESDIIKSFENNKHFETIIKNTLSILCDKEILTKNINNDIIYYSLNYKYFNDNDI